MWFKVFLSNTNNFQRVIWLIIRVLRVTTTPGQSEPVMAKKEWLYIHQNSKTVALLLNAKDVIGVL